MLLPIHFPKKINPSINSKMKFLQFYQRPILFWLSATCMALIPISCSNQTRSIISKPVGQLRSIPIKAGQVWNGRYDPDGPRTGGTFSLLISRVDNQGFFSGYIKTGILFAGNGEVEGNVTGSNIRFTLQRKTDPSFVEQYSGTYSDQIRGRYEVQAPHSQIGAFTLVESSTDSKQFLSAYKKSISDEIEHLAKKRSQQRAVATNTIYVPASGNQFSPPYQSQPRESFNDWDQQRKQEQLMERQTEAMEQMQRDASWNNFERENARY